MHLDDLLLRSNRHLSFQLISDVMLGMVVQHTRRIADRGGSGRSSLGSESPRVSVSRPNHMRDTINGQRATIAKLFEQGTLTQLSLSRLCYSALGAVKPIQDC